MPSTCSGRSFTQARYASHIAHMSKENVMYSGHSNLCRRGGPQLWEIVTVYILMIVMIVYLAFHFGGEKYDGMRIDIRTLVILGIALLPGVLCHCYLFSNWVNRYCWWRRPYDISFEERVKYTQEALNLQSPQTEYIYHLPNNVTLH